MQSKLNIMFKLQLITTMIFNVSPASYQLNFLFVRGRTTSSLSLFLPLTNPYLSKQTTRYLVVMDISRPPAGSWGVKFLSWVQRVFYDQR